ncbi:MAG: hypothetical protein ACD_20C00160G0001, partial [uncultured bacterium]
MKKIEKDHVTNLVIKNGLVVSEIDKKKLEAAVKANSAYYQLLDLNGCVQADTLDAFWKKEFSDLKSTDSYFLFYNDKNDRTQDELRVLIGTKFFKSFLDNIPKDQRYASFNLNYPMRDRNISGKNQKEYIEERDELQKSYLQQLTQYLNKNQNFPFENIRLELSQDFLKNNLAEVTALFSAIAKYNDAHKEEQIKKVNIRVVDSSDGLKHKYEDLTKDDSKNKGLYTQLYDHLVKDPACCFDVDINDNNKDPQDTVEYRRNIHNAIEVNRRARGVLEVEKLNKERSLDNVKHEPIVIQKQLAAQAVVAKWSMPQYDRQKDREQIKDIPASAFQFNQKLEIQYEANVNQEVKQQQQVNQQVDQQVNQQVNAEQNTQATTQADRKTDIGDLADEKDMITFEKFKTQVAYLTAIKAKYAEIGKDLRKPDVQDTVFANYSAEAIWKKLISSSLGVLEGSIACITQSAWAKILENPRLYLSGFDTGNMVEGFVLKKSKLGICLCAANSAKPAKGIVNVLPKIITAPAAIKGDRRQFNSAPAETGDATLDNIIHKITTS